MAEPVRCRRCGLVIFDGDTGWYHQVPQSEKLSDGSRMTFMDRVTECDGRPHEPVGATDWMATTNVPAIFDVFEPPPDWDGSRPLQ